MDIDRRAFLRMSGTGAALMVAGTGLVKNSVFAATPQQATSDVSFVGSSASGNRKKMILDVLEPWRQKITDGVKGKKILIKPNVVMRGNALMATHVDALRALLDFLRTITAEPIIIGESAAGVGVTSSFTSYNYDSLKTEYQKVSLVDLDGSGSPISKVERQIWKPDFTSINKIQIHSAFVDPSYYVISITRPKTHNCMVITGVCKNVLMGAPALANNGKQLMHGKAGWFDGTQVNENKCLAYNLFQLGNVIFSTGAPAFSVLDAWEGMEGNGPGNGTSIMQYCAVAGADPLAVDRLCAKLMGLSDIATEPMNKNTPSYTDARALLWLSTAGMGNYDLNRINFISGSMDALKGFVKTYKLPDNYTNAASNQTKWTGGPPATVMDNPTVSIKDSRFLDPKPYLVPQIQSISVNRQVRVDFSLPIGFSVNLSIYNMKGEVIRKLGHEYLLAGRYSIMWDCRNSLGTRVSPGRYIIKLEFDGSRSISDQLSLI
jgi:uncharacterized protein (DUF362 family)